MMEAQVTCAGLGESLDSEKKNVSRLEKEVEALNDTIAQKEDDVSELNDTVDGLKSLMSSSDNAKLQKIHEQDKIIAGVQSLLGVAEPNAIEPAIRTRSDKNSSLICELTHLKNQKQGLENDLAESKKSLEKLKTDFGASSISQGI